MHLKSDFGLFDVLPGDDLVQFRFLPLNMLIMYFGTIWKEFLYISGVEQLTGICQLKR